MMANVHDYESGVKLGVAVANWDKYRLWAEGPSDICHAFRCLNGEDIKKLGITSEKSIFLLE